MARRLALWPKRWLHPDYNFFRSAYWFGQVDSRPLSLFRIFFGALLLKNALYSIPLAQLFYSDEGIVPRARFWQDPALVGLDGFSLLHYLPAAWMAILFFAFWAACSLGLLVGYRTRWMAILIYLCKLSILHRNPFPLSGADHVMTVLSFWMIFLPLNHYYSLDRWLAKRRGDFTSLPYTTYAFPLRMIQIQVALIYLFTSYMKWQGVLWRTGDALYYTFQQNGYLLPTGIWLGEVGPLWLLRLLTWSTLLIEIGFTLLVFSPFLQPWARAAGLFLTACVHLGIALTMSIPDFSLVMWISYLLFLEPRWVRWLEQHLRQSFRQSPPAQVPVDPKLVAKPSLLWQRALLTIGLTTVLIATVWGGLVEGSSVQLQLAPPMPMLLKALDHQLQLASSWKMFVYPLKPRAGWLMVEGQFENGETHLLYSGADPTTGHMYRLWGPDARLRLLEQHLLSAFPSTILQAWGNYYCRLFNQAEPASAAQPLSALTIHLRYRWSHQPDAPPNPYEDDLLWSHQCLRVVEKVASRQADNGPREAR